MQPPAVNFRLAPGSFHPELRTEERVCMCPVLGGGGACCCSCPVVSFGANRPILLFSVFLHCVLFSSKQGLETAVDTADIPPPPIPPAERTLLCGLKTAAHTLGAGSLHWRGLVPVIACPRPLPRALQLHDAPLGVEFGGSEAGRPGF